MSEAARSPNLSSPEFLSRLRQREASAIEVLVRTYTGQLFRAALGLGFDESTADEIVQTTWSAFFKSVPDFEGRSHVRTYLFGILYNKASEQRRDEKRTTPTDEAAALADRNFNAAGMWLQPPANPEDFAVAAQTKEIIEACLEDLTLKQRTALVLKTIDGHATEEICKIMNVTVTNLGVLLHRAKGALRECIERRSKGDCDEC